MAARQWGASNVDVAVGVTADAAGNVYVAGYFMGSVDFDPGPGTQLRTSVGTQDGFLLQLTPPRGVIGGRVWIDVTPNGVQDVNEVEVAGVVLELRSSFDAIIGNADDGRVAIITTNATGGYRFENLPSGNYHLVARTPVGRTLTTAHVGADDTVDSDILATGRSDLIVLQPDEELLRVDTGLVGVPPEFGYAVRAGSTGGNGGGVRMVVDAEGNSYVAGYFAGTVDFDPGVSVVSLTSLAPEDAFLAKYSATGASSGCGSLALAIVRWRPAWP